MPRTSPAERHAVEAHSVVDLTSLPAKAVEVRRAAAFNLRSHSTLRWYILEDPQHQYVFRDRFNETNGVSMSIAAWLADILNDKARSQARCIRDVRARLVRIDRNLAAHSGSANG